MTMPRFRARLANEDGTALVLALMSMMLLTALGAAVVMVGRTETLIATNYKNSQEALYAADAAIERVVQDLLMVPRWNDILAGSARSGFNDGAMTAVKTLPSGSKITLCCGAGTATAELQLQTDTENLWAGNNPQWRLFAWGPIASMINTVAIDSPMYVAVWVADDPADASPSTPEVADGNPLSDLNGTLTLHAVAYGPSGTRKVIEVTVARTSTTEIERGQIAQRGQEELNQRARKAAVQTPGQGLSNMRLNTASGGLGVQ